MTPLAEAWRLAEASLAKGGAEYNECDLNTLARALLSLKPLVERASSMQDIDAELVGMGVGGIAVEDRRLYNAVADVYDALDTLRGAR